MAARRRPPLPTSIATSTCSATCSKRSAPITSRSPTTRKWSRPRSAACSPRSIPHSSYMDSKSFQDMQVQTRGAFGGLGIEVMQEDGLVKVVAPDRRHARGARGRPLRRPHHRHRRRERSGHDPQPGRRQDARRGQHQRQADAAARSQEGQDRRHAHPRRHPDQVGALACRPVATSAISASPSSPNRLSTASRTR